MTPGAAGPPEPRDGAATWPIYRRLLGYTGRYLPIFFLALGGMIVDAAATAGFAAMLEPILDEALLARDPDVIATLPLLLVALFVCRGIGSFVAEYGMATAGRSVIRDLRRELFERYLVLPAAYYDRHPPGRFIARLTYNIEQVAEASTSAITVTCRDFFYIVFLLLVMFLQSVTLTVASLLIGPGLALLIFYVSRRFRRLSRKIQRSVGDVSHRTAEIVTGHREVKIYGARASEQGVFDDLNEDNRRQHLKLVATKAASTSLTQLAAGGALAGIVFVATRDAMLETMTPGSFVTFMTAMLGILPSLKRLTNVHVMIQKGVAAADSVFEVLDQPAEQGGGSEPIGSVRGELAFDGLTLRYDSDAAPALDDVSFTAQPGTVTAVVGRSGSGKTSLVSLLARFYEPTAGRILLDGHAIDSFDLEAYRRQLAWVGQDVVLFDDTVAGNVAFGALAGASEADITAALGAAGAMEFVERLPAGLGTRLGEGGAQLSGGQRQRIAIARAMLRDAPILLLDEATSALDTAAERVVQEALARVMKSKTTIVVAHRLSTVESADQVIVLDEGRVVEQGKHAQLLDQGGVYATLYRTGFRDPADRAKDRG
ncbi:MAG: lipid A export permease/ATP-binding protein MsbA [Pseudomonadota bacterium]